MPAQPDWNAGDTYATVNVRWDEASVFCDWAGGRLPTEAEWEYAARAGNEGWTYVWGNSQRPEVNGRPAANVRDEAAKRTGQYGTYSFFKGYDDGYPETAPVATFVANGYGLYDMAGNVGQWVADAYAPYPGGAVSDPRVPSGQRGRGWADGPPPVARAGSPLHGP